MSREVSEQEVLFNNEANTSWNHIRRRFRGDKGLIGIALAIFKCADSSLLEEKLTVLLHRNDFSFCSFEMYYTLTEIESDLF